MKDENLKKLGEQVTVVTVTQTVPKEFLESLKNDTQARAIVSREAMLHLANELYERKCIRVQETEDQFSKHLFFSLMLVPPDATMHRNIIKTFTDLMDAEQRIKELNKKLFDAERAIETKDWVLSDIAASLKSTCHYELAKTAEFGLRAGLSQTAHLSNAVD